MNEPLVDLMIEEDGWRAALPRLEEIANEAAAAAISAAELETDLFAICVLACGDERIAELNATHRDKPGPTNVLSWPAFDLAPVTPGARPPKPPVDPGASPGRQLALGDVAIALQTVVREAETASIPLKNHVFHLILHGCLHLLGFDHETVEDAGVMEAIEIQVLDRHGIASPY